MKNQNLSIFAISFSIVSIGLSLFAVYSSGGFDFINPKKEEISADIDKTPPPVASDDLSEQVYAIIDQYIAEKQTEGQAPAGPVEVSLDDDAVKGDEDAPVTILEFTDYECPYCEQYFTNTYPEIVKNYIDTGKVKYASRDFPLPFHENALPAANAAECIKDQGGDEMYFSYHDLLFQNQTSLTVENYKKWAVDFDIDQEEFATCVDEQKFKGEIEADMAEGQSYGVQGTPAFFINGVPLSGAQPYAAFEQLIEAALNGGEAEVEGTTEE